MNHDFNIIDVFATGMSRMTNAKYNCVAQSLRWRQKYLKSEFYEMSLLDDGIRLSFRQIDNGEMKGLGTGTFIWPAAHVLGKYLEKLYGNKGSTRGHELSTR